MKFFYFSENLDKKLKLDIPKTFMGPRFHLFIHNASNITKFLRFIKLNLASMFYLKLKDLSDVIYFVFQF